MQYFTMSRRNSLDSGKTVYNCIGFYARFSGLYAQKHVAVEGVLGKVDQKWTLSDVTLEYGNNSKHRHINDGQFRIAPAGLNGQSARQLATVEAK